MRPDALNLLRQRRCVNDERTFDRFTNVNALVQVIANNFMRVRGRKCFPANDLLILTQILGERSARDPSAVISLTGEISASGSPMKLKLHRSSSPRCTSIPSKLIESLTSLGGVPVFNLPSLKPARLRDEERPSGGEGASFWRPAGKDLSPMWISPERNVPVQITTEEQGIISPVSVRINTGSARRHRKRC